MKISISEARRRLPDLVRRVRRDADKRVLIMVHNEVAAELRAAEQEPIPGAAVKKLLDTIAKLPRRSGRKVQVSSRLDEFLYQRPTHRR